MDIVLDLPYPPPELSPNATKTFGKRGSRRIHWGDIKEIKADYGAIIWGIARKAMEEYGLRGPLPPVVRAHVTFLFPDRRRRDQDNAQAMLKTAWDSCVRAGLLVDDNMSVFRIASVDVRYRERPEKAVLVRLESGAQQVMPLGVTPEWRR